CLVGPAQRRERPQAGGEPGVEHVRILVHRTLALRTRGEIGRRDVYRAVALAVPGGDTVAPPQLSRDAPRPDVVHPVVVRLRPAAWNDTDLSRANRRHRFARERLDVDVPLLGDERLDDGLAAIADAHGMAIRLGAVGEPQRLHVLDDLLARLEAVEPCVLSRGGRHLAFEPGDGADRQLFGPPHRLVPGRVAQRALAVAGAQVPVDRRVGHDLHADVAVHRWDVERLTDVLLVTLVLRVHGETGVAKLRFRAYGAERERPVLDVHELCVALFTLDLEVGEHGLTA